MRWSKYLALLLLMVSLGACSTLEQMVIEFESAESETESGSVLVGDVENGREIFRSGTNGAQRCGNCHRVTTRGFAVDAAPNLAGISQVAGERVEGLSTEEYLRDSILNPLNHIEGTYRTPMPEDYAELLTDQEVADLIAYMMQLE